MRCAHLPERRRGAEQPYKRRNRIPLAPKCKIENVGGVLEEVQNRLGRGEPLAALKDGGAVHKVGDFVPAARHGGGADGREERGRSEVR